MGHILWSYSVAAGFTAQSGGVAEVLIQPMIRYLTLGIETFYFRLQSLFTFENCTRCDLEVQARKFHS